MTPGAHRDPPAAPRWLEHALRALALLLGAVHTAVAVLQQSMNEDGIGYLDLGDAWLDGNWEAVVNRTWSPAYAWLVAAAVRVVDPPADWEFPTVQVVNFCVYAVALFAFGYFWRHLTAACHNRGDEVIVRFPPALWLLLGYSLFIWSSLDLVELWAATPDMSVAVVVYVAAGMMVRLVDRPASLRAFAAIGLLLGFGFLVKAALLPLGVAGLLLAAATSRGSVASRAGRFGAAIVAMLIVAAPLIAALSWSAGHLTMGDVGRFTYLKHVNEMPYPDFHDAIDRLDGAPVHPPSRVYREPPVYAFAEPIAGTYPMAYDPAYWTAGLKPVITASGQARALITAGMTWFDLFVREQGGFVAVALLLCWMRQQGSQPWWRPDAGKVLVLWSLAAFGLYSLVHVELRYVAPFVVLFWAGALSGLRFRDDAQNRRLAAGGALLLSLFVWVNLGTLHLDGLARVTGFTPLVESAPQDNGDAGHVADHPVLARELSRLGLVEGDEVGIIGYAYSAYWARLARVRIVAEVHWHDQERFWSAPPDAQAGALAAFRSAGAVAVIAEPVPRIRGQAQGDDPPPGWMPVGDTGYLFYSLRD